MSLSGDFADMAKPALQGYQLWADTVNAHGGLLGRKVDLKIVDDASNPTQAVTNYENLISADKVNLVFGPFSSLLTIPTATVAHRFGYAFIEPSGAAPQVFSLHLNDVFLAQPAPIISAGNAFANYILSLPTGAATEDGRLPLGRRPVHAGDRRCDRGPPAGSRHQDGVLNGLFHRNRGPEPSGDQNRRGKA